MNRLGRRWGELRAEAATARAQVTGLLREGGVTVRTPPAGPAALYTVLQLDGDLITKVLRPLTAERLAPAHFDEVGRQLAARERTLARVVTLARVPMVALTGATLVVVAVAQSWATAAAATFVLAGAGLARRVGAARGRSAALVQPLVLVGLVAAMVVAPPVGAVSTTATLLPTTVALVVSLLGRCVRWLVARAGFGRLQPRPAAGG